MPRFQANDRLPSEDAIFLYLENQQTPLHIGSVHIHLNRFLHSSFLDLRKLAGVSAQARSGQTKAAIMPKPTAAPPGRIQAAVAERVPPGKAPPVRHPAQTGVTSKTAAA